MVESKTQARVLAFYLPQFHPIRENDEWWGKGFTEWTNVVKARPFFPGHYQPHLPADLGFYDLRLPESREDQAALAREYGIHGFCYYHYWFNGRMLLERPFNEVLASRRPDFPFCLCWANEDWTRSWDGLSSNYLIRQDYNEDDDRAHIRWLIRAFEDPRYIRVCGKPLLLVYRAASLPNPARTAEIWREEVRAAGIEDVHLCRVESLNDERENPAKIGFDAAVEFQPDWLNTGEPDLFRSWKAEWGVRLGRLSPAVLTNYVFEYKAWISRMMNKPTTDYLRYPCVTPFWDNSARRKTQAVVLHGSTPELYEEWLGSAIDRSLRECSSEPLVFVNAWNEWGEGSHLEPCQAFGRSYLEATRRAIESADLRGR